MKRESRAVSPSPRRYNSAMLPLPRAGRRRVSGPDEQSVEARLLELLPQVRYIARRIHSRLPAHVPFDDLLQAGVVGLIDALRKFDPRRKVQIESYMKFRIRGAILDELRSLDWSPRELRRKARRMEEAEQQLRARLGREPTTGELAKALGLSLSQFHQLTGEIRGLDVGSLQETASTAEEGLEQDLSSRLATTKATSPFEMCTEQEQRGRLEEGIRRLPEKERLALTLYYYEELTMKEVGKVLAVGESRVSQIHSSALERLRRYMEESANHPPGLSRGTEAAVSPIARMGAQVRAGM